MEKFFENDVCNRYKKSKITVRNARIWHPLLGRGLCETSGWQSYLMYQVPSKQYLSLAAFNKSNRLFSGIKIPTSYMETAFPANLASTTPDVAFGSICPLLKTGGEFHHCLYN